MNTSYAPNIAHVGVCCFDIDKMINFYAAVFGLQLTDKGPGKTFPFLLAFMSSSPDQHHQLAFSQNRPEGSVSTVMQLSFKVQTLDNLREARARALQHGATGMRNLNHGNALSIYFMDPEENLVEVYLDTPWYVAQPHGDPLDLTDSDEKIWADTERVVRQDPTFMSVEAWSESLRQKLAVR
jgi:catechol 2,3-dioxygenase